MTEKQKNKSLILYDGECALCQRSVSFIRDHENSERFEFISFQSEKGKESLQQLGYPSHYNDSVILINNRKEYLGSDAIIHVLAYLKGPWSWLAFLKIIPRSIREYLYKFVSRNRYRRWLQKIMKQE